MKEINVGIVGANHGLNLLMAIANVPGMTCTAMCGMKAREVITQDPKIRYYDDVELMADNERLDALIIATPSYVRKEILDIAARRDLFVLVEKPLAISLEQANTIISMFAERSNKVLVGHHRRFSKKIDTLKELLESDIIGRVLGANVIWSLKKPTDYFCSWKSTPDLGGGIEYTNIIHEIDTLRYLFGEIENVKAFSNDQHRKQTKCNDVNASIIKFVNGEIVSLWCSDFCPCNISYEHTMGENNTYFSADDSYMTIFGTKGALKFPTFELITQPAAGGWYDPVICSRINISNEPDDPLVSELLHFSLMIRNGVAPKVTAEDATLTLKATLELLTNR